MIDTTTVGKSIAWLRKQKQMTQQGLAAAVNVSHQAVSKWENGVALPDMQTMLALSRLFGVSMEALLSGDVLEAAGQPQAPQEPAIELKLEGDPLNMSIVAEADDAIARAMEQIDDEPEGAPQPEIELNDGDPAQEEPQATVQVGMRFDEIVRMAPFVSSEALEAMLRSCESEYELSELAAVASFVGKDSLARLVKGCRRMDWDSLRRLAPFLSRDALKDIVLMHVEGVTLDTLRRLAPFLSRDGLAEILANMPLDEDFSGLKKLAPFLSKDALYDQLRRYVDRLDVNDLLAFAPFLRKDALGDLVQRVGQPISREQMVRLAKFLPKDQMDRLVYRAMGMKPPKQKSDDWNVEWNVDLGRAYNEIRDAVQSGMHEAREAIKMVGLDGVVDGINNTMKDIGGRINDAINDSMGGSRAQAGRTNAARERSQRIRERIAAKALADGNWDWLDSHIGELEGDLLKQVLMKCAAAGHEDMICAHMDRVTLNSAEACRLAQTCTDEDVWAQLLEQMEPEHRQRVLDYIGRVQPESLENFARFADEGKQLEAAMQVMRAGGDAGEMMEALSPEEQLELIRAALDEGYGDVESLLEHMDASIAAQAMQAILAAGRMELIGEIAQHVQPVDLPGLAAIVAQHGAWEYLGELLDGVADVDLSAVWPLAIENEKWDALDDIALHGDENTLRGMSAALAELGRFDEMESFIEELDPDTLETLLDKAMEKSDWNAIDRISELLND